MKAAIDLWANFLANEKLVTDKLHVEDIMSLISLSETMAMKQNPWISSHFLKLASRRFVCETAMDLGIDLPGFKHKVTGKHLIGRGLLDMWLKVYQERFGDTYGTAASKEAIRRNVKTRLSRKPQTPVANSEDFQASDGQGTGDQEKRV